jgi:myo-inositol-1(or 4)-monophosphatase
MACVSVAAVPAGDEPTMGDVVAAAVQEIKSGDLFVAEKGAGFGMRRAGGGELPFRPTARVDLESLFWTLGFRGRPAVVLAGVLAELIDTSSVGGSVFDIGSATYSVTRILTGQLDAYVDIGPAIIAAHPALEAEFRRVGRGHVLCNSPYDLAAVHLLCREAGVPIGDADGAPLDDRPVLGSDASYQMACIAAGNEELRRRLVEVVQRGIRGYAPQAPAA